MTNRRTDVGTSGFRFGLALVIALAAGCSGDTNGGASGDDGGPSTGESCLQPGATEAGCTCSSDQPPGVRECREDATWSPCNCPPARGENGCDFDGQTVICRPCAGESEGRRTTCRNGTFDCSCSRDAGAADGG